MRVLDLYCGAGGAATGYARAGWDVIGVDIIRQPAFPYEFWRMDALTLLELLLNGKRIGFDTKYTLDDFDLIHSSPPCQLYTAGNRANPNNRHPDLVEPTRTLLQQTGLPYVIENVPGAPLHSPVELCGRMFGLGATDTDGEWLTLDRHRIFETSFPVTVPANCRPHDRRVQVGGVYGGARREKFDARHIRHGGYVPPDLNVLRELLGIEWMNERELFLAIPPKYTEWIAQQFVEHIG